MCSGSVFIDTLGMLLTFIHVGYMNRSLPVTDKKETVNRTPKMA